MYWSATSRVLAGFRAGRRTGSHFEDDGQDQRPLRGLLVDVTLQVHANLFLDNRPIGALLRIRAMDGPENDIAGAGNQVIAVVAHEAARDDFRVRFEFAAVFVYGDDR